MSRLEELLKNKQVPDPLPVPDPIPAPVQQSREDLLIQFLNIQEQHYSDMKELAHQHAKMSSDLINLQLGAYGPVPPIETMSDPEYDSDLLGGEIGANEPTRDQEG